MRNWLLGAAAMPLLVALTGPSRAEASPVAGTVVTTESRWAHDHSTIVTESVVAAPDGSHITVHQPGGSVEGIAMRRSHGLPVLRAGDEVTLDVTAATTASGRTIYQLAAIHQLRHASPAEKSDPNREFVRTENASGSQIYWKSGCALLSTASEGSTQIAGDTELQVIGQTMQAWDQGASSCSDFALVDEGTIDSEVGFDGINVIKFREDQWCRPATKSDPQECYDQAAAGITTLFFIDDSGSDRNGEILDADIELNGVQFAFSVGGETAGSQQCQADLANTLTHELGHLLGLDHTCWIAGPRLEDNLGNEVPSCTSPTLDSSITEATMYNFQSCGETKKATLESDDIAGMCAVYPIGVHPTTCTPASIKPEGCCSVAGGRDTAPGKGTTSLALLGLLGLVLGLRRSRAKSAVHGG